jgi:tRNA-Thr(GGU) m(6)t(6)A37 methyltransferase TsaA
LGESASYLLKPIGSVESTLKERKDAPRQPFLGAPEAWLAIDPQFLDALDGIAAGSEILVLTWLHQAKRDVMKVRPGRDPKNPITGVFATRSPDRPNPVGLHRVKVLAIEKQCRLKVDHLEAIDGTPIVDIKAVLADARAQ